MYMVVSFQITAVWILHFSLLGYKIYQLPTRTTLMSVGGMFNSPEFLAVILEKWLEQPLSFFVAAFIILHNLF
jgi:ABC-type amino acid transport system permease subunit